MEVVIVYGKQQKHTIRYSIMHAMPPRKAIRYAMYVHLPHIYSYLENQNISQVYLRVNYANSAQSSKKYVYNVPNQLSKLDSTNGGITRN